MLHQGVSVRERRDSHRLPLNRLVKLNSESRNSFHLIGLDYSSTGIAVQGRRPLDIGEQVEVRFRVGDTQRAELDLVGEVVRNSRVGDVYTTGIRFLTVVNLPH